jgi:quercetin dioxygenase-like cupin family protein
MQVTYGKGFEVAVPQTLAETMTQREGRFDVDPQIQHHFSDRLYAKRMVIPKGYEAGQHSHKYSHLSILAKGRVVVKTDTSCDEYEAPACIEIKSGVAHTIQAIDDSEWYCVHATDETDVDKIDQVLIERN